ncbi:MAG: hypothetical protein V4754_06460 [Pseudomonadota bacterium]
MADYGIRWFNANMKLGGFLHRSGVACLRHAIFAPMVFMVVSAPCDCAPQAHSVYIPAMTEQADRAALPIASYHAIFPPLRFGTGLDQHLTHMLLTLLSKQGQGFLLMRLELVRMKVPPHQSRATAPWRPIHCRSRKPG